MDLEIIRKFRENLRILERELDMQNKSCCCCGVTLSQCHLLLELDKTNNISLNELSEKLAIDKSSVSKTVENLVKANLIIRTIPKEDRRVTNLSLTKEGIEVCKKINTNNDEYFKGVLSSIPEEELPAFNKSFEAFVNSMKKANN